MLRLVSLWAEIRLRPPRMQQLPVGKEGLESPNGRSYDVRLCPLGCESVDGTLCSRTEQSDDTPGDDDDEAAAGEPQSYSIKSCPWL